ncbi:MAG: SWIM zinc finger family protein, partial [Planctomycetaceae bacterium]|nr:SWIM zinc finger family protein [Planctomycetaceae bacterium]
MMIDIDEAYVDSAAPNAGAIKNGRGLVLKGKFIKLHKSDEGDLLFGECQGSGRSNYQTSCDFSQPEKPVFRCSCPSRQFPCKHGLGLLYAYAQGKSFDVATVPEDLAAKREKSAKRVEKKKVDAQKPRKVNLTALKKKINAQLSGLDLLEKLTHDLVRTGMGSTTVKTASQIEQQAKQLGNAYLPGAQAALLNYTRLFAGEDGRFDDQRSSSQREATYSEALDQLSRLNAIIRKGRDYLENRLNDPNLVPETDTSIAAWLGHAWQLRELADAGLIEKDVELVQLAFNSYDDLGRKEYVDTGIWVNLSTGKVQLTQNFRPYRAANHIRSDDSFFDVAQVAELYVYPGDVNPRIRWESMQKRSLQPADLGQLKKLAHGDYAKLVKEVKSNLKGPLADKSPVYLIQYSKLGMVDEHLVVEDGKGERLVLAESSRMEEPPSCYLLGLLPLALQK